MPAWPLGRPLVMADAGTEATGSAGATDVDVIAGRSCISPSRPMLICSMWSHRRTSAYVPGAAGSMGALSAPLTDQRRQPLDPPPSLAGFHALDVDVLEVFIQNRRALLGQRRRAVVFFFPRVRCAARSSGCMALSATHALSGPCFIASASSCSSSTNSTRCWHIVTIGSKSRLSAASVSWSQDRLRASSAHAQKSAT